MEGKLFPIEPMIYMGILVIVAFVNMYRLYRSITICQCFNELCSPIRKCTQEDVCNRSRLIALLNDVRNIFQPKKQFYYSVIALVIAFLAILISILFPPNPGWDKFGTIIRGAATGSQLVILVLTYYLARALERLAPIEEC